MCFMLVLAFTLAPRIFIALDDVGECADHQTLQVLLLVLGPC